MIKSRRKVKLGGETMNMKKLFLPVFAVAVLFACSSLVLASAPAEGGGDWVPDAVKLHESADPIAGDSQVSEYDKGSGRTTMTYSYRGGVLASIYNHDDNTVQHFSGGNMTEITLSSGETIYKATYKNGHIVSSTDQYGDTTSYNKFGQKTATSHSYYDHYDEDGVGYNDDGSTGPKTEVIATYSYNSYGQLASQTTKVADEGDPDDPDDTTYSWQTMTYNYNGATLESINVSDEDGNALSQIVFSISSNGDKVATTYTYTADASGFGDTAERYKSKVTTTSAATGRKSDTYWSKDGVQTGSGTYDEHNRLVQTKDMDGNITKTIIYDGAKRVMSIAFEYSGGVAVLKNTTYFDQFGNMTHTVQDCKQPGDEDWTRYDPWTEGEMTIITHEDGTQSLAMIVDPDDVDGTAFYNFDPREKGNCEEELDENGNPTGRFIVYISAEDPEIYAALADAARQGQTVNLCWQLFATDEDGNLWLHLAVPVENNHDGDLTGGEAVWIHLNGDDWQQVNGASDPGDGMLNQFYIIG